MVLSNRILPSDVNPRPNTRFVNKFDSPPTAGSFTKVSPKPTNHSKFTGKCATPRCTACHVQPECKSRDKTRGTHKHNFRNDVVFNTRLLPTGRVVDPLSGSKISGLSVTHVLDHLFDDSSEDVEDDEDML